jgi:hypothetical protein
MINILSIKSKKLFNILNSLENLVYHYKINKIIKLLFFILLIEIKILFFIYFFNNFYKIKYLKIKY